MTKQKILQNGEKTTVEPEKKSEGATTKEKDDKKKKATQYHNRRNIEKVEGREPASRRWRNSKLQERCR